MIKLINILREAVKRKAEYWKPVLGYEKYYEISSNGRLKRLAGESPFKRDGYETTTIKHDEVVLKPRETQKGYMEHELITFTDGKRKKEKVYVHRLVAQSFLPKPKRGKDQVNHINGNTQDNRYSNLEWVSNDENQYHAKKKRNKK
jgi:hypothetical protein